MLWFTFYIMQEIKENKLSRVLIKNRLNLRIIFIYAFVSIFLFFLPYIYTLTNNEPVFVSGFKMLVYLEDSYSYLKQGITFYLCGYVSAILILIFSIIGLFSKDEINKMMNILVMLLLTFKFAIELTAIIMISNCLKLHIHSEFGSYLSVILSGCMTFFAVFMYIRNKRIKKD